MSYFANINEDNIVEQVISAPSVEWCEKNIGGIWLETSSNTLGGIHYSGGTPLRKNYAGVGYSYDESLDAFIAPKPYISWVLNQDTCLWEPPVAKPIVTNKDYKWVEEDLNWQEIN